MSFGGDEVFANAKSKIINEINSMTENELNEYYALPNILRKYMNFIKDGHFTLAGSSFKDSFYEIYYYSDEYEFTRKEDSYFITIDNEKYKLIEVDGSVDLDNYIKLTINNQGDLVYIIGALYLNENIKNKLSTVLENLSNNSLTIKETTMLRRDVGILDSIGYRQSEFILPNSKILVQAGSRLQYTEEGLDLEIRGYMPDLWLNPADSLDRVIKYINKYLK